jgi:hypothetical protein
MFAGCGKIVVGGACALCARLSCSNLARMASRGAACRAQSSQMCWIVASTGSGGITSAIKRLLSSRCCSAAASSLRRLFLANAGLGNAKSANIATCVAVNANSAAHATNKEQCCSSASAISLNVAPHFTASWC